MLVSIRECGAVEKPQRLPPHLSYASLLCLSLSFHLYNKLVIVNKAASWVPPSILANHQGITELPKF